MTPTQMLDQLEARIVSQTEAVRADKGTGTNWFLSGQIVGLNYAQQQVNSLRASTDAQSVVVSTSLLDSAIAELEAAARESGDDHSVGICSCATFDLVFALKLTRGDVDAQRELQAERELDRELEARS